MDSPWAYLAITAVLIAVIVVVGRFMPKNGRRTTSQYNHRGWLLTQWPDDKHLLDSHQGKPFRLLKRPEITESYSGNHRGRNFFACNFNYTDHGPPGTLTTTEWLTHAAVTLPGPVQRVDIDVKERGTVSGLADSIGLAGRSYGDTEFDERFNVSTDDETFARKIINGRLGRYLGTHTYPHPLTIEHGEIRTWLRGTRVNEDRILDLLNYLCDAADAIPSDAWPDPDTAAEPT